MENKSNRVIMWSGGPNSTYCVKQELFNYKMVEAWTINWSMENIIKRQSEQIVREKFKNQLARKYELDHKIIELKHKLIPSSKNVNIIELMTQLSILLIRDNSTIIFPFTIENKPWRFKQFVRDYSMFLGKNIEIEFPIENKNKIQILEEINQMGLKGLVWSCENPKDFGIECEFCDSCLKRKLAEVCK